MKQGGLFLLYLCLCCSTLIRVVRSGSEGVVVDIEARKEEIPSYLEDENAGSSPAKPLMVGLTLIQGADSRGAVCLDGTLPGYHLHRGYGTNANSWLIQLEGGGWCDTIRSCNFRKTSPRGSSKFMKKLLPFTGILSDKAEENPDFFNWNRVKLRYCDGASFTGDGQDEASQIYFRGQHIWSVAMEEFMSLGMQNATQALLSGCSAGGLASILHCDEFRDLFPQSTRVKCLSDAGMFLDAIDVSGGHTLRNMYAGVVSLQGVSKNLPITCTSRLDPTSCFFPQNLIADIKTPLFLLNSAYDKWQTPTSQMLKCPKILKHQTIKAKIDYIVGTSHETARDANGRTAHSLIDAACAKSHMVQASLAPPSVDPRDYWKACKRNYAQCNSSQLQFLQDFRDLMLEAVKVFSASNQNGLFINSGFAHCQSEYQYAWLNDTSPRIGGQSIAQAVGDWYFEREVVKDIDCAYPCDNTSQNPVPDGSGSGSDSDGTISYSESTRLTFTLLNLLATLLVS